MDSKSVQHVEKVMLATDENREAMKGACDAQHLRIVNDIKDARGVVALAIRDDSERGVVASHVVMATTPSETANMIRAMNSAQTTLSNSLTNGLERVDKMEGKFKDNAVVHACVVVTGHTDRIEHLIMETKLDASLYSLRKILDSIEAKTSILDKTGADDLMHYLNAIVVQFKTKEDLAKMATVEVSDTHLSLAWDVVSYIMCTFSELLISASEDKDTLTDSERHMTTECMDIAKQAVDNEEA